MANVIAHTSMSLAASECTGPSDWVCLDEKHSKVNKDEWCEACKKNYRVMKKDVEDFWRVEQHG